MRNGQILISAPHGFLKGIQTVLDPFIKLRLGGISTNAEGPREKVVSKPRFLWMSIFGIVPLFSEFDNESD